MSDPKVYGWETREKIIIMDIATEYFSKGFDNSEREKYRLLSQYVLKIIRDLVSKLVTNYDFQA